jgi:3-methylcrotonyl-CoA carboxylase alpha subunit
MIARLLIANRAEIAVRVARAAREMGIVPLGIYSDADADAYHLCFMDESARIGAAPAADSYLNIAAVIAAANALRADAVHPGYGFLSERAAFARAVEEAGMIFVGPPAGAIEAMGSKIEAKRLVRSRDVPTVPGYDGDDQSPATLRREAERIGFPVLIKASAGGGGRGMRVVEMLAQFDEALEAAKREALAAFGDDAMLLEKYLIAPRHIEFQILADEHGHTVHVGERECSIQRRHQKIVEEAPSVALTPALRAEMGAAAVRAAQSVGYTNAGTCEFMLDARGGYYFLEMNARLQVEHPVTELAYGIDLVQWQLRIANGERLTLAQDEIRPRGWAIEARIYAEDPANHLLPSTGTILAWRAPGGPGVRVDAGVDAGSEVGVDYDPMLAKLICSGADRAGAIACLRAALDAFVVAGVRTNVPLLKWIAHDGAFAAGDTTTSFLAERLDEAAFARAEPSPDVVKLAAEGLLVNGLAPWRMGGVGVPLQLRFGERTYAIVATASGHGSWRLRGDVQGDVHPAERESEAVLRSGNGFVVVHASGYDEFTFADAANSQAAGGGGGGIAGGRVRAPMPGKIAKVAVQTGDAVAANALLIVLEAMKMEHRIEAPGAGTVRELHVRQGDVVAAGAPLVELSA